MNYWKGIKAGNVEKGKINAVVEIPKGTRVKYEVDATGNCLTAVRELNKKFKYPFNYGFIPNTLAGDNDPLDAVVLGCDPIAPLTVVKCVVIGMIRTIDEGEQDDKILMVPEYIKDITVKSKPIMKFFQTYKFPYQDGTQVDSVIYGQEDALNIIKDAIEAFKQL